MLIDFISSIDSREIATLIWLSVLVIWAVTKTNVRKSFSQLIDALFAKQIIITLGLMALYIYIGAVLLW